ncbi:MAG: hypothetical protein COV70_03295 [Parcubacteria group bacterium CG11_big_fil_rev_8_21_14_0_20_39_22]|nr:MAG: hypothetical protein COV70_03295 [Parcubacteria group bacterium CG11_big_fil_rev_8_21_14_0_20_39_22]
MNYNKIIFYGLSLFLLIGFLHLNAVVFFLYWEYWWFDIPMHFLGGAFAGLVGIFLLIKEKNYQLPLPKTAIFLSSIFGAIFIGAVWEIYEYVTNQTFVMVGTYRFDVVKDMVFDVLGSLATAVIVLRAYGKGAPLKSFEESKNG